MLKVKLKKKIYDVLPVGDNQLVDLRVGRKKRTIAGRFLRCLMALLLMIGLNWAGLMSVGQTLGYFSDLEISASNKLAAGILDFELFSEADFTPEAITCYQQAKRDILVINNANLFKYLIKADDFSSCICQWLDLEVSLDGGPVIYSGPLVDFAIDEDDLIYFEEPEQWHFVISTNREIPCCWQSKECNFNFIFAGSQTRHNLAYPFGFSDQEEIANSITLRKACYCVCLQGVNYWKRQAEIYKDYLPLELGCQTINFIEEANNIFVGANNSDATKHLKAQLLALKFNLAHFGVGDYQFRPGQTLDAVAAEADALLCQNPLPPRQQLRQMANLLRCLNQQCFWYCPAGVTETEVAALSAKRSCPGQFSCDSEEEIVEKPQLIEGIDVGVGGQSLEEELALIPDQQNEQELIPETTDIEEESEEKDLEIKAGEIELAIDLPALPQVELPEVNLPAVELPEITIADLPKIELPEIDMPLAEEITGPAVETEPEVEILEEGDQPASTEEAPPVPELPEEAAKVIKEEKMISKSDEISPDDNQPAEN